MILRRAGAGLAGRVAGFALTVLVILARVAIAATLGRAQALLVEAPALDAAGAAQCAAGCTAGRTRYTFASLLVRAVTRRARGATRAVQSKQSGSAGDTLVIRRAVTGLTGRMARRAIVVLRLVRVGRARGVTFVLVHHQMMLAAGALVRSVLAAGAVGLAWHARAVLGIFVVALGALLKTDRQIGDPKVSGGAREAGVLTCTRANFAGFVTRPANAALIREAPWRTAADASVIETIIFTSDALRRALAVATLRVALRIAVVQYPPGGVERTVRLHG